MIVAGLLAGLLISEMVLFFLGIPRVNLLKTTVYYESERAKFTRYDSLLGWAGLEGVGNSFNWMDTSHYVRQNRYGFRGSEHPFTRTDKSRLLVLGDSFVWGFGVEDRDIFTSRLEEMAKNDWEIVNLGVSGYGTDQEYLLWHHLGRQWQPDKVLLVVTPWTDLWDNISPRQYGYEKPFFYRDSQGKLQLGNVPVPRREVGEGKIGQNGNVSKGPSSLLKVLSHSAIAAAAVITLARHPDIRDWLERRGVIPNRQGGFEWEDRLYRTPPDREMERAWDIMFTLIARLNREVKAAGGSLSVAAAPSPAQVYVAIWKENIEKRQATASVLDAQLSHRLLGKWCSDQGIPYVDLLTPLRKAGESNAYLYFPINLHWTPDGHAVVADVLYREILMK